MPRAGGWNSVLCRGGGGATVVAICETRCMHLTSSLSFLLSLSFSNSRTSARRMDWNALDGTICDGPQRIGWELDCVVPLCPVLFLFCPVLVIPGPLGGWNVVLWTPATVSTLMMGSELVGNELHQKYDKSMGTTRRCVHLAVCIGGIPLQSRPDQSGPAPSRTVQSGRVRVSPDQRRPILSRPIPSVPRSPLSPLHEPNPSS